MNKMILKNRAGMIEIWFAKDFITTSPAALSYTLPARPEWFDAGLKREETASKVRMMLNALDVDISGTGPTGPVLTAE